jgi:hypothetical protein
MLRQKSLFAKDSKTFETLKSIIRYKKIYNQSALDLVNEEFVKERTFRTFHSELETIIKCMTSVTDPIVKEHFQNILEKHLEDNVCSTQLEHFCAMLLLTHFTKKPSLCLQMVLNKMDFQALFDEYGALKNKIAMKRFVWEIFLEAVSRKMVTQADAVRYLQTFISDFISERSKNPVEQIVLNETIFSDKTGGYQEDFQSLIKILQEDRENSLFTNVWLFDKKLVQMMLVYYFVSVDLQGGFI